jgi:amidohydrolase
MDLSEKIKKLSDKYFDGTVEIRRQIHKHPELSFNEFKTSEFIQSKLREYGIPFKAGYVKTGIVAKIEGKDPKGKVIALRADMDALPIREETGLDFQSVNDGVMHACGHDAHTAALLGAARILNELKDEWRGTVLLVFQPGEEVDPGGARLMLQEGIFDDIKPDVVIGQHVLPEMQTGHVGFKEGMYMASGDEVHITIKGKGGHAAMPHALTDTVLIASQVIVNLQQIASRFVPAGIPVVLSFGKIVADGATNIIPEKVRISGTFRIMNEEWRSKAKKRIEDIVKSTAESMGAKAEIDIKDGYPVVFNNIEATRKAALSAREFLGNENVEEMDIRMTAEDFGFYSREFPSVFYRFGVKREEGETGRLHTSTFNLNEEALRTASGTMAAIAVDLLKNNKV